MKPIKLAIAGLHSFREKQEIDFEALCSGGVFGIFGPTGSGKSSILDAMTLALYGKVERASNNTQGIMNHAEDQLSVSFTFELENAEQKKRYRVERSFKRTDSIRLKTSGCRLLEEGEETVVIADKANEVNEKIHELLGLTVDDFTRAVVLPQGKFAEFLSLKGSERRQMLQRLFNLEQYGDLLNKKLKMRLQKAKTSLSERIAEQAGLGDASKEAVAAAKEEVEKRKEHLKKVEEEYDTITKTYEEKRQIWNLQLEKDSFLQKQKELDREKAKYEMMEKKLEIAETAERLKPYAEAVNELRKEKAYYESETKRLEAETKTKKAVYEKKHQGFEDIRNEKIKKEPVLLQKREKLTQLIELVTELEKEQKQLASLNKECQLLEKKLHDKQVEIQKLENLLNIAYERQKELKKQLKENAVSKDAREKIRNATELKQKLEHLYKQRNELQELKEKKDHHFQMTKQKVTEAEEKKLQWKKQIAAKFQGLQTVYHHVCERQRELERFLHHMKMMQKKVRDEIEEARTHEAAKQLAFKLAEGEPCPVCGSTHHPAPKLESQLKERPLSVLQQTLASMEEKISHIQEEEKQIYTLKLKLEELSASIVAEQSFLQKVQPLTAAAIEPIFEEDEPFEHVDMGRFKQLSTEIKALNQDFLQVKEALQTFNQNIRQVMQIQSQYEPMQESLFIELKDLNEKIVEMKVHIEEEEQKWQTLFPELSIHDVEKMIEQIREKDAMVETLTERIETSISFLDEKEKEKLALKEEERTLSNQLSAKKAELHYKQQSVEEKQNRLNREEAESDKLHEELEEIEETLKRYKTVEQKAYEQWQTALKELQQLESEFHTAKKQMKDANVKLEKAEKRWEEEKKKTSFQSIESVLEAILSAEEKQSIKAELLKYQEEVTHVKTALQQVIEKLKGQFLSESEWLEIQTLKHGVKARLNEAVEQKGAAETQLKVLFEKHERYMEIEKEKKTLQRDVDRMEHLQQILKGNSFVEYIAEKQLEQVSLDASERLGELTRRRYAIEVDSQGGFIMRDDANGGVKRPVSSLSGGETFLTSLALALSLSVQIQLSGQYPLQFFFLDEGFGTLDSELLDTVISALEKLQSHNLSVGVISHVQELRARLPKRLIVEPAEPSGRGTRVKIETL
jgi:exonuclease SbcC